MVNSYQNSVIAQILEAIIDSGTYDGATNSEIADILLSILNETPYEKEPTSVIAELFLKVKAKIEGESYEPYDKPYISRIAEILISILNESEYTDAPSSRIAELLLELKEELESYTEVTTSGAICSFNTNASKPLVSLKAGFIATQEAGTPTPSEPKAINGVSSIKVYHRGANLFDEQTTLGGYSSVNGSIINYTDRTRCLNPIYVKPNTSYVMRLGTTASVIINAYDKDDNFISNILTGTFGTNGRVFSTPANCYIVKFSVGTAYGTTYNNDISINYPNSDLDYNAYNANSNAITIALGGTYYGGELTQDKDGKRAVKVTHKIQSFSVGSWSYGLWGNRYFFSLRLLDAKPNSVSNVLANSLCDIYEQQTPSNIYTHYTLGYCINNDFIRVQDNNYNTLDNWKNAVKNYNYVYELAEPFTVNLPDGLPIITFVGDNNIFNDSENTEVTYLYKGEPPVNALSLGAGLGLNTQELEPDVREDILTPDLRGDLEPIEREDVTPIDNEEEARQWK